MTTLVLRHLTFWWKVEHASLHLHSSDSIEARPGVTMHRHHTGLRGWQYPFLARSTHLFTSTPKHETETTVSKVSSPVEHADTQTGALPCGSIGMARPIRQLRSRVMSDQPPEGM